MLFTRHTDTHTYTFIFEKALNAQSGQPRYKAKVYEQEDGTAYGFPAHPMKVPGYRQNKDGTYIVKYTFGAALMDYGQFMDAYMQEVQADDAN